MSDGYDPTRSKVSNNTMKRFVDGNISGNLQEVPGIGPAAAARLAEDEDDPITNTWMLFGVYMKMKGPDGVNEAGAVHVECREHNDRFWYWLKNRGVASHRSAIVQAIAQKSAQFFPGIYDPSLYGKDEEDEEEAEE